MAEATTQGVAEASDQETSSALDAILSRDLNLDDNSSSEAEDTATAGDEQSTEENQDEESGVEGEAEGSDEEPSEAEGEESEGEESDEGALLPQEEETDFSDEVYARYAKRFSKPGQQIDPTDPVQRMMLREVILRGQALARQKAESEQVESPEEEAEETTQTASTDTHAPANVEEYLDRLDKYTEPRVNPKVAAQFSKEFTEALWPGKGITLSEAQQKGLLKTFMKMGLMLFTEEMMPATAARMQELVSTAYPHIGRVHQTAVTEEALERLEGETGKDGTPLYPDLDDLADKGVLRKVFQENAWIKQGRYVDQKGKALNPVAQAKRELEIAVKLARGEHISPNIVKRAVETGKKTAQRAASRVAASRLSAGRTMGSAAIQPNRGKGGIMAEILEGSGSKFAAAVARDRAAAKK